MSLDIRLRALSLPQEPVENGVHHDLGASTGAHLSTRLRVGGETLTSPSVEEPLLTLQVKLIAQGLTHAECGVELIHEGGKANKANAYDMAAILEGSQMLAKASLFSRVGFQVVGHTKLHQAQQMTALKDQDLNVQPGALLFTKSFNHSVGRSYSLHAHRLSHKETLHRMMPQNSGGVNTVVLFPYGGRIEAHLDLRRIRQSFARISVSSLSHTKVEIIPPEQLEDLRAHATTQVVGMENNVHFSSLAEDVLNGACRLQLNSSEGLETYISHDWRVLDASSALLELKFHRQ